ncbi:unnamed protein product (macronuclear) [Paramecium tetraurelia]|uniref:Uncharacterized protein n=1 Tax=Paramecium tetraurelia TaxID=5888 RepID=A0CQ96_PARTE|nr:uncharacterized protein GSPATT00009311001 [Paramecium tetraurelia]CAK72963.1 unnamed protein product [Paramecium tetraurelia]|eukprot:XP_001440360.1 hypothetical protein (macronuclear) [Paramecium tetraurelia strain d4-2]
MLSAFQKEVNTNFSENQDKSLESQNELQGNKMRIILMAIEIERLNSILNSKIDYYNQKMQDYIKRGQNYMQNLELFYKGQIVEYLQQNTELNQQILEKNALISKIFLENSQQEMNMLITQQCLQFEQELKNSLLRNLQLQKEIQELHYQFDDAPQLRKQLNDLEQLYSQLLIQKNEEIQQLRQNNPQLSLKNSQLATLNQLLEQKELELQEWQYSSQQSNLIHENQRLTKDLKFLNDKLNLLLISNDHQTVKQEDIQTKNYYQPTNPNKFIQENDQRNETPRRQQINTKVNQFFKRPNTPQPQQISINFQSLSQEQRETQNYQNINLINDLLQQILLIQNQKIQSKQSINNQISLLNRVLNIKQQEMSQYLCQNNIYVINHNLSKSPQIITNPKLKRFHKYYSVSPNNCYSQPYAILQPHLRSRVYQHSYGIKTETTILSYQNIFKQQLAPVVMMPQNVVAYPQSRQGPQIHYHFSPIQKTVVKQNFQNPPYFVRGIYPNETAQFCKPIKINVNQPNLRVFERQEQTLLENSHQPQFDVYTTEFQVNSQENINNEVSNQKNFQNKQDANVKSQKQNYELDRRLPRNTAHFNENDSISQKSFEIQDLHIFNKITLQEPVSIVKQKFDSQQQSEEKIKENDSLYLIYKQFQDFRLIFKQKLQRSELEIKKTYSNSLEQLQNLENQILVLINEKQQKVQNQRDNKFNRISQEYQNYKIQQPNSDHNKLDNQTQVNESNDFLLQIASQKKLLNEQQTHFLQLIQIQDEIQNYYEPLVSQLYQRESELNKEVFKIKQDHENQMLNLTRLQKQSEEISHLEQQNSSLQHQLQDYMKDLRDIQLKLKFEQDQHQFTKHVVQSLQKETNTQQNTIEEIQKRNTNLEQQLKKTEQFLLEIQSNSKKQTINQNKETQTISIENKQSLNNDQIEIENLKQKLFFEQELSNQLNDSISELQQQIQTQEQLLQQQKLSNSNQFEEIQNLTKEKIEIAQQLKMIQIKYLSLKEQLDQMQKQKDCNQNSEQIQNMDVIQNLNFQIEDMKQLNSFLQNQLSQMQQNSEVQISAQNTVLSSKIALLEKQLSTEKVLKEQANIKIIQLEKQFQGSQNQLSQGKANDLKEQIFQLSNQQQLLQQQKERLVQSFELELNQLKQQITELTNQNQNYQEQVKDFETKQLLHLQLQKQYTNQTHLLNQQQQQIIILEQENHQNQIDLQKLRQNLKLDIEDFEGCQNDQINKLRKQIDDLNSQFFIQQRDINYLQSQIQFEQREKKIIIQNKTILDGHIKQMQEENLQLQNQIFKQQNDIEQLQKNMRQYNIIEYSSNQKEGFIYNEQKTYKNQNESLSFDITKLKQENQTLIQECQKLKDALFYMTEEKNRLEKIFNYQNQVQETQFQQIQQSQIITQNNKNEEQDQVKQNKFYIEQNKIWDLSSKISAALVKLEEFDDLNFRIQKTKQDLQNQIQKLKQQAIYVQQLRIQKKDEDKIKKSNEQKFPQNQHNQKVDEISQIIQALIISIGDHIQLNSQIVQITEKIKQLLGDTNSIAASIQLQNQTLKKQENVKQKENSSIQTNYEEQYKELMVENDKLNQKANQYQHLLIQLQDEYYKQGSALDSITKEYQQINNKNEFKIIKLIHFEQLNDKIYKQELQIEEQSQQIQDLQNYIDQEQKQHLEEITRLNNQIVENQLQGEKFNQLNQENSTLKQDISNLQSVLQKQQDLIEEQKLIYIQNQEEYTQLKQEAQRLYQRLLQMSNSNNILKEEKEQELQRFQRESRQIQESSEKHKNENIQFKLQVDRLQKQVQEFKNQSDSNLQQQLKKVQTKLDASLQQQKQIHDEKRIINDQIQQQQEQLANQQNTIHYLKQEISRQEQVISQLSQQNNIQSSFVQEVTFFDDSKNSSPLEFKVKQLQNENTHLHQLLLDMEKDYAHKIKLQQLQIQGLNDKLREMVYEQTKKVPKLDELAINYQNH